MRNVMYAIWRALRVFVACAIGVMVVLPVDKWLSKETLALAIGAGIAGLFKYLRDTYNFDVKIV